MDEISGWIRGRLPEGWYDGAPEITVDREEIVVVGRIRAPDETGDAASERAAEDGRIQRFREDTRAERMQVAREAEHKFGRKVAWGAECGETRQVFTSLSVPMMTRLRQPERRVLDTLVAAGVARSRADALGWCVRLVGRHEGEWIDKLRDALVAVDQVRAAGPAG
jgi:hypothetical protein